MKICFIKRSNIWTVGKLGRGNPIGRLAQGPMPALSRPEQVQLYSQATAQSGSTAEQSEGGGISLTSFCLPLDLAFLTRSPFWLTGSSVIIDLRTVLYCMRLHGICQVYNIVFPSLLSWKKHISVCLVFFGLTFSRLLCNAVGKS